MNKQIEEMGVITDLLIDFDEMGFAPTTACPDPEAYTIEWREKLTNALKGYRKADEVAREIFEGDIVKGCWDTIVQVVYDDCYLGFRAKEKDGMHNCIDYYGLDRIEVVGNIHDNSEMLEGV